METSTATVINADAIRDWVDRRLVPLCPAGAVISVINRPWHCRGESEFFAAVDVIEAIPLKSLCDLAVAEHSRGEHLHFYVDHVVAAAVGSGDLVGNHFYVHYCW